MKNELFGNSEQLDCSDCVNHGGDWDCDHVHCHKGTDTISRQAAIDAVDANNGILYDSPTLVASLKKMVNALSSAQPVLTYQTCSDALLKMWMDNVVTDGEYNRIMDKLNAWKGGQDE